MEKEIKNNSSFGSDNEEEKDKKEMYDINKQKKNNKQFIVVDNVWIEKWKEIVKYELIKNKCQKYIKKQSPILKKEISDNLKQNNSLEKFNE